MLKHIFILLFAFGIVTLNTACPADVAKNVAEEQKLTAEYNDKVKEANNSSDSLAGDGLFTRLNGHDEPDWGSKSKAQRTAIRAKLTHHLELVNRLSELADHKNVKADIKAGEKQKLADQADKTRFYLNSLDAWEKANPGK